MLTSVCRNRDATGTPSAVLMSKLLLRPLTAGQYSSLKPEDATVKPFVATLLGLTITTAALAGGPDIPPLVDNLKSAKSDVRMRAAEQLAALGPAAAPAVPQLIAALEDSSATVQAEAMLALGRIGPAARDAVPALIAILKGD